MVDVLNLINGRHVPADDTLDLISPATGKVYGTVPRTISASDAIMAAHDAASSWRATPVRERSRLMHALADAIESDLLAFSEAESIDNGKPVELARTVDIPRAVANLRWFASSILEFENEHYETGSRAVNDVLHVPVGVIGAISPWNLPLYLFTWKIAPALATGNTVVAKPSEVTPLSAHRFSELASRAGLPPGVLNVVQGRGDTVGARIVEHPDVPTITFTGGTSTGEWIARTAAPMFKRLSLELGGKNSLIVFADCDIDTAVDGAVRRLELAIQRNVAAHDRARWPAARAN